MRFLTLAAYFCGAVLQEPLADNTLLKLKQATCFVRTLKKDSTICSASGFLLSKEGDGGLIVTSSSAIILDPSQPDFVIQVVLNSGDPAQKVLAGFLLARDQHLALVKVISDSLPQPLGAGSSIKPRETLPVFVLGYPFDPDSEFPGVKPPSLAVTQGRITQVSLDAAGKPVTLRVDAEVAFGVSGGPVVDSEGSVLGVVLSRRSALPLRAVEELILGKVTLLQWTLLENKEGTIRHRCTAILADPFDKVRDVSLRIGARKRIAALPKEIQPGHYEPLQGDVQEFPLRSESGRARGEVTVRGEIDRPIEFVHQLSWTRGDGKRVYSAPQSPTFTFEKNLHVPPPRDEEVKRPAAPGKPRTADPEPGDWLEDRRRRPAVDALKSEVTGTSLSGQEFASEFFRSVRLSLEPGGVEPCISWTGDGTAALLLDQSGLIRRVSIPDLKEERRLKSSRRCSGLARSKAGLVVHCVELQELWVLDERTLEIVKRIPAPQVTAWTASPASTKAYATRFGQQVLDAIDLVKGTVTSWEYKKFEVQDAQLKRNERSGPLRMEFAQLAATADGKYILVASSSGTLHRLRIEESGLVYEEAGPGFAAGGRLQVSADSKYVTLARPEGHALLPGMARVEGCATMIFKVEDLQKPVIVLTTARGASVIAFDREARRIHTAEDGKILIAFNPQGERVLELPSGPGSPPRQFLAHPSGNRLLLLNGAGLYWVELLK